MSCLIHQNFYMYAQSDCTLVIKFNHQLAKLTNCLDPANSVNLLGHEIFP